jgi:hypothetical protein
MHGIPPTVPDPDAGPEFLTVKFFFFFYQLYFKFY